MGLNGPMAVRAQDMVRFQIHDGGVERDFELATNELSVRSTAGRSIQSVSVTAADFGSVVMAAKAERRSRPTEDVELVLYTAGRERTDWTRRHVTRDLLVRLPEGVDAKRLAGQLGLRNKALPVPAEGLAMFEARTSEEALAAMQALRGRDDVTDANVMLARQRQRKFEPDDPLFSQQWHHRNTTQTGGALWVDTGITEVWDQYRGTGITISVIDDGVQHTHPDLEAHYDTTLDYDYNSVDDDAASVDLANDAHGTSCAGVAAGVGNNALGVAGAAFEATLTGVRLIAAANTDADEAGALSIHNDVIQVKSNSWGTPDTGADVEGFGPLGLAALQDGVTNGRGGKGVIYVFAGGNGLDVLDNSNYDGYTNGIETIAVGAVSQLGSQSWYSEPGANLVISAPSSGGGGGITTVDILGEGGSNHAGEGTGDLADRDYTQEFGGTSSACPLVAGICALMLEANPDLGWRDVQEILITSARRIHHADPDWTTNGAGFSFNHKYGAGMIDAKASVALSEVWTNLGPQVSTEVSQTGLSVAIPDDDAVGITRTFNVTDPDFRVEHATLTVDLTHTARGDLEIILTSPSGMVSRLAELHFDGGDNFDWTFMSVRHWGENAAGGWTVKIADRAGADVGTLNAISLKLYGTTATGARFAATSAVLQSESNLPANAAADPGERVTFDLTLRNVGDTASTDLTASLLGMGGITPVAAGGNFGVIAADASAMQSFEFSASGTNGSSGTAILRLEDDGVFLGFVRIPIPLGKVQQQTYSGGPVTIVDEAAGSPSPSLATVSGMSGRLQHVACSVQNFTHTYPNDVTLGLGNPGDFMAVLFSSSTSAPVSGANITFDDHADLPFAPAPAFPAGGSFRPYDWYGVGTNLAGVPAGTVPAYTMGEFYGREVNGDWRLFVEDAGAGDVGSIGGWDVQLTTVDATDNVFFATVAPRVAESDGTLEVSVVRTGGREGTATVLYATANGSAEGGVDFTPASDTLTFGPGETVKTFSIAMATDSEVEGDETILVTLSDPTGETQLGADSAAVVTLEDSTLAGYLAWQEGRDFGPGDESDLLDDPNLDGTTNLACYACNVPPFPQQAAVLMPGSGTSGLPHIQRTGNRLRIEFLRRRAGTFSGLTYRPQFGTELAPGQPGSFADATETPVVTPIDDTWERVVVEDSVSGADRRFGRLLIEYAPPIP